MTNTTFSRIWKVVGLVPTGRVASYGQVADLAGLPGRARLTSKAMSKAPKELNLPWHRIVRSSGQIAFPAGSEYAQLQRTRLLEEGVVVKGKSVRMKDYQWQPDIGQLLFELDF